MKKNELKLLASRAVNKIGNVVYDYGNSSWIVSLGPMAQRYLGYYQLAENLISLFLNPIGGAVADRGVEARADDAAGPGTAPGDEGLRRGLGDRDGENRTHRGAHRLDREGPADAQL